MRAGALAERLRGIAARSARPTWSRAAAAVVRDVPGSRESLGIGELKEMLRM